MRILAITPQKTGSAFYRIYPQMKFLKKAGHNVKVIDYAHKDADELSKTADLVIYENIFSWQLVRMCKKAGTKVIIETDDLVHDVPKTHYNYKDTKGWGKYKWLLKVLAAIFFADGLIVSNELLKKQYGWVAKKCLVFPNYCDIEHWIRPYNPNKGEKLRLLWAGSASHKHDLLFIKPIIRKILTKYKNKVKFIYIGVGGTKSKDLYARYIYGDDIFEDIPYNRESLIGVLPEVYPHILGSLHADIAIAPLTKDRFNHYKTPCKYLEYSINKIPAVYSKWFYKDIVKDTGSLADDIADWINKISFLIENEKYRKKMAEKAYNNVLENHNITKYLNKWQDFIETYGYSTHSSGKNPI